MFVSSLNILSRTCHKLIRKQFEQIRFQSEYRAALVKTGDKELAIETRERSEIKDNEVRIQVHYCSVNSNDLHTFQDESKKLPFTPGYELAGEVIEIGKNIKRDQIMLGEKVAALSLKNFGGFAEECVLDIDDIFRIPSNLEVSEAAVLTSAHSLAMLAFSKMCKLNKDDYVVVSAGPAGLGLAAVDVATNVYGAKVIGVVDTDERAELLRKRGAFKTIPYSKKLLKHVLAATDNKGAKIVYDAVGEEMLESVIKCVTSGGRIFLAAPHTYKTIPAPPLNTNLTILDLMGIKQHHFDLYKCIINDTLELADQNVISGYVSAKFDFDDINKAIEYIREKKSTGKIVINIL